MRLQCAACRNRRPFGHRILPSVAAPFQGRRLAARVTPSQPGSWRTIMQRNSFRMFWTAVEDASHDIARACRRIVRVIAVMSWPAILVCCIGLAMLISILPLALFLFILFMGVKIVIAAFVIDRRRTTVPDYKD
jgi:hypothetical protein